MTIELRIKDKRRNLDAGFCVPAGEQWALVGPNGSGKSTILDSIAGLHRPSSGAVTIAGRPVFVRNDSPASLWVPPHGRQIGYLSQQPTLFPHLNVRQNVEFGPRSGGKRKAEARARANEVLALVEMSDFADRRPFELSGGQAQRVAFARALAADPDVMLLDEPMSALDAEAVPFMRRLLAELLHERTVLLVTHDPLDALALTSHTVVLAAGEVVDQGPTQRVIGKPKVEFTASLGGMNLVRGIASGAETVRAANFELAGVAAEPLAANESAIAVFSPRSVVVSRTPLSASPRNSLRGRIDSIEQRSDSIRLYMRDIGADLTVSAFAEMDLEIGTEVYFSIKAMEIALYRTGTNI